jgi:hypothetical protein
MKAILILFALLVANSMAANYTFANIAGGSWKTESNWDPVGIPGPEDDGKRSRDIINFLLISIEQFSSPLSVE